MKKTITLLLACLIGSAMLVGQQSSIKSEKYLELRKTNSLFSIKDKHIHFDFRQLLSRVNQLATVQTAGTRDNLLALDSLITQFDISGSQDWMNESKTTGVYDALGYNTDQSYYLWDYENEVWMVVAVYSMSYNNDGQLTEIMATITDPEYGDMMIKGEFLYYQDGKPYQDITYFWNPDTEEWDANNMDEYIYNEDGSLFQILGYWYEVILREWDLAWKEEFDYDGNGNMTTSTNYHYSGNDTWSPDDKTDYTYDNNDFLIQDVNSLFDYGLNEWVEESKSEYAYDSYDNLSVKTYYLEVEDTRSWVLFYKDEFTYNNNYTADDLLLPQFWFGSDYDVGAFKHMLVSYLSSYWDTFTEEWITETQGTLYYSEHTATGIDDFSELLENEISIYPNPATDFITFNLNSEIDEALVSLYDVNGKEVLSQLISVNNRISVTDLEKGLYIYTLKVEGTIKSGKIMIE